jgi:hypothetical protein
VSRVERQSLVHCGCVTETKWAVCPCPWCVQRPASRRKPEEFLLPVFGPRSRVNKTNSLYVLSFLERDDMADASLVSKLWNSLCWEADPGSGL